jgi:hypothetical protein
VTGRPRQPAASATEQRRLQRQLDTIAELHTQGPSGFCPTCLLDHPCRTYLLATGRKS